MRPGGVGVGQAIVVGAELPKTTSCFFWIVMTVEFAGQLAEGLVPCVFALNALGNVMATNAKLWRQNAVSIY
jgi:hypothetical protein